MTKKKLRSIAQSIATRLATRYKKGIGFEIAVIEEVEFVMFRDAASEVKDDS